MNDETQAPAADNIEPEQATGSGACVSASAHAPSRTTKKKRRKSRRPKGRPSVRKKLNPIKLRTLAEDGKTLTEIAEDVGVSRAALCKHAAGDPVLMDAMQEGRERSDDRVVRSLYQRALGCEHDEDRLLADGTIVTIKKRYPPEVMACLMWLKNRRPKEWRDKQEIEHSGEIDILGVLSGARARASKAEAE